MQRQTAPPGACLNQPPGLPVGIGPIQSLAPPRGPRAVSIKLCVIRPYPPFYIDSNDACHPVGIPTFGVSLHPDGGAHTTDCHTLAGLDGAQKMLRRRDGTAEHCACRERDSSGSVALPVDHYRIPLERGRDYVVAAVADALERGVETVERLVVAGDGEPVCAHRQAGID